MTAKPFAGIAKWALDCIGMYNTRQVYCYCHHLSFLSLTRAEECDM